jgi:hypothetical protein
MASDGGERDAFGRTPPRDEPADRTQEGGERAPPERPEAEPAAEAIPPRLVVVAYVLAALCTVAPLAVLGAGFAGAVLFTRGRRGAGAGVVATAALCAMLGIWLRS